MGDGKYGVLLHVAMTSTKSSLGGGGGVSACDTMFWVPWL